MQEMTPMERVMKTLKHEEADRVPVFFLNFNIGAREAGVSVKDFSTNGKVMAGGIINFVHRYKVDIATVGTSIALRAEAFGTKTKFYDNPNAAPVIGEVAVKKPEDWGKLEFHRTAPGISAYVEAMEILSDKLCGKVPILGVLNDPLTLATHMAGMKQVMIDIKKNPEALHKGLNLLTELYFEYINSILEVMKPDMFMVPCSRASKDILTPKQHEDFCVPYDLKVFEFFKSKDILAVALNSSDYPYLDVMIKSYPMVGITWWDRRTEYSLRDVKQKYGEKITLMGGLDQTRELLIGTPKEVEEQAKDAIKQAAKGGGFMLCTGGSELSPITPPENIHAAVNATKKFGKYPIKLD